MPKSEGSVTINAPTEKVFDAIADQEKAVQYYPAAVLIGVKGKPDELTIYTSVGSQIVQVSSDVSLGDLSYFKFTLLA